MKSGKPFIMPYGLFLFVLGIMKSAVLVLAVIHAASSINILHTTPTHVFLASPNPTLQLSSPIVDFATVIQNALPAQRLPVQGFGWDWKKMRRI